MRRDKTDMIAQCASPLVMKTRGTVLWGLGFSKDIDVEHNTHCRLSSFNQVVHSGFIAEDKDVAGMVDQTPRIKLCLAGASVSSSE